MSFPDSRESSDCSRDLYPRRWWELVIGVVGSLAYLTIGVVSTVSAALNHDGAFRWPIPTAVVFGILWSVFFGMSVRLVAGYFRNRLTLGVASISWHGVMRTSSIAVDEIRKFRWRIRDSSLLVSDSVQRIRIPLRRFTPTERVAILRVLRLSAPTAYRKERRRRKVRERLIVQFVSTYGIYFFVLVSPSLVVLQYWTCLNWGLHWHAAAVISGYVGLRLLKAILVFWDLSKVE